MKKFLQEFKVFAMRGNVIDMAVGVIIGGAFGKIITSLVNDILMPPIGWLIGGMDFTKLCINLPVREGMDPVTLNYGNFIQVFIDFVIVAFCIFMMIKGINKLSEMGKKKEEETPTEPEAPKMTKEEELLTEIRDLLKKN